MSETYEKWPPANTQCGCYSYNLGVGEVLPVVLDQAEFFPDVTRSEIEVDACLAPLIRALWKAGVRTCGCCCGHGRQIPGMGGNVYVHLVEGSTAGRAQEVANRLEPRGVRFLLDAS